MTFALTALVCWVGLSVVTCGLWAIAMHPMGELEDARNRDYPVRCQRCFHFKEHCRCPKVQEQRVIRRTHQRTLAPERKAAARWN